MRKSDKYEFSYKAPSKQERKIIEDIRKDYLPKPEATAKMQQLQKLDNMVKGIPMALSLSVGIVGTLIFGLGLAMVLEWNFLVWGILVSVLGCGPIGMANYVYNRTTQKLKDKYGETILKLSEELLNEDKTED